MTETKPANMALGEYLRRLRESRKLSQRQVATQAGISYAYLSQIEGSKRGKRKKSEENFAPHPQFLKKLADVYHVPAGRLFEQAGYLDNDKAKVYGFSEKSEIDRIFDFIIHDPALLQTFSTLDKRAIIRRYETLTGKRLITWAGDPEKHPSVSKTEYAGLRHENGLLVADTPNTKLTVKEVAQELELSEAEVEKIIKNNQLLATENDFKESLVEKSELQRFKIKGVRNWIHTGAQIPIARPVGTLEEQEQHFAAMAEGTDESEYVFRAPEKNVPADKVPRRKKKARK